MSSLRIAAAALQPAGVAARRVVARPASGGVWQPRRSGLQLLPARPEQPSRAPQPSKASNQDLASGGSNLAPQPAQGGIGEVLKLVAACFGVCLVAAAGGVLIQGHATPLCETTPEGCTAIPLFMKLPLIATHLFTFILSPATMYVFYTRAQALKGKGAQDPFVAMVGLAFVMVAIAGEMAWHVNQEWFYVEEWSILNCTGLWAVGIKEDDTTTSKDEAIDALLLAAPWLAGIAYLAGATVLDTKVPIYILMSLLKDPKVFLFPFFSVGVNLFFIAQLNTHQSDPVLNPLFHILHDAAGTELGVAIIAFLVYQSLPANTEQIAKK
ncbi:hypothetical protein ABPG75_008791 [Micractinium tetrahymenae]